MPMLYHSKTAELFAVLTNWKILLSHLLNNIYAGLNYMGLYLLPISLFVMRNRVTLNKSRLSGVFISSIILLVIIDGLRGIFGLTYLMPLVNDDMLFKSGLGPLRLRDIEILQLNLPILPESFWWIVTILTLAGTAILLTVFATFYLQKTSAISKIKNNQITGIFFLFCAVIYLLPLIPIHFHDRYAIPTLAFFAAALLAFSGKIRLADNKLVLYFAIFLLATFAIFSITSTKDYLSWNRARWLALQDLMNLKINPKDIDGGFEFNGWYLYDPHYQATPQKSRWWVKNDDYLIASQPIPGYKLFKEYSYPHYLPSYNGKILVLKKI